MTVRRFLPLLLALALGVGAAALVACGDSGTKDGIPGGDASALNSDFEDVQQAVDSKRCSDLDGQLGQVDRRIDRLSGEDVDNGLVDRLRQASQNLRGRAADECNAAKQSDKPKTTDTTPDTQTETTPTVTTVEPPPETETQEVPPATEPPTDTGTGGNTTPAPGAPLDQDTLPQGGGVQPDVDTP